MDCASESITLETFIPECSGEIPPACKPVNSSAFTLAGQADFLFSQRIRQSLRSTRFGRDDRQDGFPLPLMTMFYKLIPGPRQ